MDNATLIATDGEIEIYRTERGKFVTAQLGKWLPGNYSSPRAALEGARQHLTNQVAVSILDTIKKRGFPYIEGETACNSM